MEYLNIPDLDNIVNEYYIGEEKNTEDLNEKANLHGADFYITRPSLEQLCLGGHILLVKKYIKKYTFDKRIINDVFKEACSYGHLELAQFLIKKGAYDLSGGLKEACSYGHLKIAQFLIKKGAYDLNGGLFRACYYGHLEIMQYLIELGADNSNGDLIWACRNNHLNIVQFLVESGKKSSADINEGLNNACTRGNFKIIEYLNECERKLNITLDFNGGLYSICSRRKFVCKQMDTVKVAKYIIELGRKSNTVFDIAKCVNAAIQYEDTQLVDYLLSLSF